MTPAPFLVGPNQPPARFYRGGDQIAAFRGAPSASDRVPEDWIASTTSVFGEPLLGQSRLEDGRLLSVAVQEHPVLWLGSEHVSTYGADPMLLVKLLDAGQRLPVHAHPSREFAGRVLGAAHGKAEAWYILSAGVVHLGLQRPLARTELSELVAQQDLETLLGAMHSVEVQPGDRVFVPPGVLHAIGEGTFLAEVQEPEDLSILLEWKGFDLPESVANTQLGVELSLLLEGVELGAWSAEQLDEMIVRRDSIEPGLPPSAEPYFRLDRHDVDQEVAFESGFAVIVGLEGSVQLCGAHPLTVGAGQVAVVPAAAAVSAISGGGHVLVARPPLPQIGR